MIDYPAIKVTPDEAEKLALKLFNIKGKASVLPGELDFNFRLKIENGEGYILKVSRPNENEAYLDFQQKLLQHIEAKQIDIIAPKVNLDVNGKSISEYIDDLGNSRKVRLLSWISGRIWSSVNPQLDSLRTSLGAQCGKLTASLMGFEHPMASRDFQWDIAQSLWTKKHLDLFEGDKKEIIAYFQNKFEAAYKPYSQLRKSVVHNDANDNNVIVSDELVGPIVKAAIDYGDAVHTQIINDVAIACAYAIMHHNDPLQAALPLVSGYHDSFPLMELELQHLYTAIAM